MLYICNDPGEHINWFNKSHRSGKILTGWWNISEH